MKWSSLFWFIQGVIGVVGGQYVGDLFIDIDPEGDVDVGIILFDFGDFSFGGLLGRFGFNDGDKIVSVSKWMGEFYIVFYVVGTEI